MIQISKKVAFLILALFIGIISYFYCSQAYVPAVTSITNAGTAPFIDPSWRPGSFPSSNFTGSAIPVSPQVIKSLLGLEVKFLNGNVNYPGLDIINDPRYQALLPQEKMVDAIRFQPSRSPPFLLLIAIGKNAAVAPAIVPGKFDIIQQTDKGGLLLKDPKGRLFYYSGYILQSPLWNSLFPGQDLRDSFCKRPGQAALCSPRDTVTVNLKKSASPLKDIPLLLYVR